MATKDITSYKVVNPAVGNDYFDTSATAISASIQPVLNLGRATNLGTSASTSSAGMSRIDMGDGGRTIFGSKVFVSARQGVSSADFSGTTSITGVANSDGLCLYTKTSHGLAVGDSIIVADSSAKVRGPQRIIKVPNANTFLTDKAFTSGAGTLTYGVVDGTFAVMTVGNYIVRRLSSVTLRGIASNILRSGASDYGIRRSIHKVEHGRTSKVATAIRAGYWNEYSGVWSTKPTDADDSIGNVAGSTVTNGTADHAATPTRTIPGELVYRQTGNQDSGVVLADYDSKTG